MWKKLDIKQEDIESIYCIIDESAEILEQSEKDRDIKNSYTINRNTCRYSGID